VCAQAGPAADDLRRRRAAFYGARPDEGTTLVTISSGSSAGPRQPRAGLPLSANISSGRAQ
jgi:hypothetical protein